MTLKTKLMMFIPLVLVGMSVSVGLFLYGRTAFEAQEHHRFEISQLETRVSEVRARFLEMRLNEKDFLLRMDETYATRHAEASEELRHDLAELRAHAARLGGALDVPQFTQIEAELDGYLAVFHELVEVEVERGLDEEAGLVGELREAGGAVEALVDGFDRPEMMILIQQMRRYEEDFILQIDRKYVDLHTEQVAEFKAFPASMLGGPAVRAEVLEQIDVYHEIFERFADVSLHEQEARGAVSAAYADIETLLVEAERAITEANGHAVAAIDETERRIWTIVYSGVGIASLVIALIAAVTAFSVSQPLRATAQAMSRLAEGQDDVEVPGLKRRDEIGDIARAFEGVQELTVERARRAQQAEKASAEERHAREAEEHARAQEEAQRREVERQQLDATVGLLAEGLEQLSAGDLTHRIETPFIEDLEHLRQTFNGVMGRLQETIGVVDKAAREVLKGSQDIRGTAEKLSSQAIGQAASLEETAATMEEISETVKTNAQNAAAVSRLAVETRGQAERGREIVAETVEAMGHIRSGASEIGEIVTTIDAIAFQTNLLALNAAVEAARAGDAGKGFAVVASEVRTLAQRSSEAAKTIGALIARSTAQVAEGDRLVGTTDKALSEILDGVREVASTIEDIANASREQTTGVEEVSSTVGRMDEVTQQNAGMADRSASAARSLAEQSQKLVALVEAFDTKGRGRAKAAPAKDGERAA